MTLLCCKLVKMSSLCVILRYAMTIDNRDSQDCFEHEHYLALLQARKNVEPLRNLALRQDH